MTGSTSGAKRAGIAALGGGGKDNRRLRRWHLIYYLRVLEADTGTLVGHIVDLTTAGMMLISDRPRPVNRDWSLVMEVPLVNDRVEKVRIVARSLWCRPDVNPSFHDTGFEFIQPDSELVAAIERVIGLLHLDD